MEHDLPLDVLGIADEDIGAQGEERLTGGGVGEGMVDPNERQ